MYLTPSRTGNRLSLLETTDTGHVARLTWAYDGLNRLVRETRDAGDDGVQDQTAASPFGADYTDTFAFDLNSNRVSKTHDEAGTANDFTVASTYDLNDRLLSENSTLDADDKTFTYDLNGSLLTKATAAGTTGYDWDAMNRLVGVDKDGDGSYEITYTYDANGVRVTQTVDGVTTTYLHDGSNPTGYSKPIEEKTDGLIDRSYVVGLVVESQFDQQDGARILAHDAHGSTRAILDAVTAEVVQRLAYDAFGETLTGTALTEADAALTTWLFAGDGSRDAATGLTYHLERYRSGNVFVSTDPYRGSTSNPLTLHHRGYVHQNPIRLADPSGRAASYAELLSVSGNIASLTRQVTGIIRLANRAKDFVEFLSTLSSIYQAATSGGLSTQIKNSIRPQFQELVNFSGDEVISSLLRHTDDLVLWSTIYWTGPIAGKYKDIDRFVVYMPNVGPIPYFELPFKKDVTGKIDIVLGFGHGESPKAASKKAGRLVGVGVGLKGRALPTQIWRMDVHPAHDQSGEGDAKYIVDWPFHYHVRSPKNFR